MESDMVREMVENLVETDPADLAEEHCEELLSILVDVLEEPNHQIPLPLVIDALFKLTSVLSDSHPQWENVVKQLREILKTTDDIQVLVRIFRFFFLLPVICAPAFNTVVSVFPALPGIAADIKKAMIELVSALIIEDPGIYSDDDYPSEDSLSILVSLLSDNDRTLVNIVAETIEELVNLFLKSDRGINIIKSSNMMESLLEMIQAWDVDKPISAALFKMLIRMHRNSQLLRSEILALGFCESVCTLILRIIENLHTYTVDDQLDYPVKFLKEVATHSEDLPDEVCFDLALHIISVIVALERCEYLNDRAVEVLEILLENATEEMINTVIKNTTILPYLSGILNYSHYNKLIKRSLKLLQNIEDKLGDAVYVSFAREGIFDNLSNLQRPRSSTSRRYNVRNAKVEAAKWQDLNNLTAEIKKKLSVQSVEAHQIVLKALKEISKVDENGKGVVTGYEFVKSGFASIFLVYLLDRSEVNNSKSKKRARSNSVWEEDDCNMQEGDDFVNFRVKSFISHCLKSGEDASEFLKYLVLVLSKTLFFMTSDPRSFSVNNHKCLLKSCCMMQKSDPKHDYMLLAKIVNQASYILPSLEAEYVANATYEAQLQGCPVYTSAIKEYRPNSLPKDAMKSERFTHFMYREMDTYLKPNTFFLPSYVSSFAKKYHFMLSLDARILYLDATEYLGEAYWPRELDYVTVDRNSLLPTSRQEIEQHCFMAIPISMLFVRYEGEQGEGRGPTTEFFTIISDEFQKEIHRMWRGDATTGGLFPRPWPSQENIDEICLNFKLLGQVMAIALRDKRLLDIHLSQAFYKVALLREELSLYDVFSFDEDVGKRLVEFNAIVQERKSFAGGKKRRNAGETAHVFKYRGATFREMGLDYVVPGYEKEYPIAEFPDQNVGLGNLEGYIKDLHDATVGSGVRRQVSAFQSGFSQVLPLSALQILRADEMDCLFCGQNNIDEEWISENLHANIDFAFDVNLFNPDSTLDDDQKETVKEWVLGSLLDLNHVERINFLKYATATSRLPQGGLANLHPRLNVNVTTLTGDESLPSVMTCFNQVRIPRYSSKEVMGEKIKYAIEHGQGYYAYS